MKYSYQSNVLLYPQWQAYFREYQPPTLVVWGKNDRGFLVEGAYAYKRDLQNLEFHLLDTGHFALEEDGDVICASPKGRHQGRSLSYWRCSPDGDRALAALLQTWDSVMIIVLVLPLKEYF